MAKYYLLKGNYRGVIGRTKVQAEDTYKLRDEVTAARDVTLNLEAGEADMTSRANAGWRATRAALRDGSIDFDLIWDGADTKIEKIRAAYFGGKLDSIEADFLTVGQRVIQLHSAKQRRHHSEFHNLLPSPKRSA